MTKKKEWFLNYIDEQDKHVYVFVIKGDNTEMRLQCATTNVKVKYRGHVTKLTSNVPSTSTNRTYVTPVGVNI